MLWTGSLCVSAGDSIIITSPTGTPWTERSTTVFGELRGLAYNSASGQIIALGKAWAQVGNDLNIATVGTPVLAALSSTP